MSERDSRTVSTARGSARRVGAILAVGAALSLTGCSSVPDAVNPVEWYRGAKNWWNKDSDKGAAQTAAKPVPGENKPFPRVDSVPQKPRVSTEAERKAASDRLAADRRQARYTDQQVKLQSDERAAAAAAPSPPPASASPAPSMRAPSPPPVLAAPSPPPMVAPAPAPRVTTAPMPAPAPAVPSRRMAAAAPPSLAPAPPLMPQVVAPPQTQMMPGGTARAPGGSVVFGAPPTDIAAMTGGAMAAAPGGSFAATPDAAGYRGTRSPFSRRFPAGVQAGYTPPAPQAVGFGAAAPDAAYGGQPLGTVKFGVGSSKINSAARRVIRDAAQQQKARGGTLVVIGHASSRTKNLSPMRHYMANFRVSVDRANAVARELVRQGVPAGSIQVSAVSDTQPAFFEVMPAGEAGNRRAVIVLQN
jgi:outer membrane protein OmpA-like peptidoglycan-associated protein